ncbi:MAG: hypothetical protein LUE23_09505 [Lachnospiraceae bacterium]|nr:hypothetical protein [Lachnospiraceae bacterium]
MMKKFLSILLIMTILCSICFEQIEIDAASDDDRIETVYIDGIQFDVFINDEFEIEVEGHTDSSDAYLTIDKNGVGEVEIENDEEIADSEQYDLEIEELSLEDADIEIYEDGDIVEEITTIDEIIEDDYNGQASVVINAGGAVITTGLLLEAAVTAGVAVVIGGVVYIVGTTFYEKVNTASKTKSEKAKKYYYKAHIYKGQVLISPNGISKSKAIARVQKNLCVYSFTSSMAKQIVVQAGYRCSSAEIDAKRYKGHIYFYHFHKASSKGNPLHTGGFHSFYGAPVVGKL